MTITYNIYENLAAWSNHTFALRERCGTGGNAYECITAGTSTVAPTGTGSNIANGGAARFKWLSTVDYTSVEAFTHDIISPLTDDYVGRIGFTQEIQVQNGVLYFGFNDLDTTGHSITLTCMPGDSFYDQVSAPLNYDATKGVAFNVSGASAGAEFTIIQVTAPNIILDGIQFRGDGGTDIVGSSANTTIQRCIIDYTPTSGGSVALDLDGDFRLINNLFVDRQASGAGSAFALVGPDTVNGVMIGCTTIATNSPAAGVGFYSNQGGTGQFIVRNSAFFGHGIPLNCAALAGSITADHSATSSPSFAAATNAGSNLFSRVATNQFLGTADFRLKLTSELVAGAVIDTTNNPSLADIYGHLRGATWDIGAAEAGATQATASIGGTGSATILARIRTNSAASFSGIGNTTFNAVAVISTLKQVSALISAFGNLSTTGLTVIARPVATLPGVGSVTTVVVIVDRQARSTISSFGTVILFGAIGGVPASALIQGIGSLTNDYTIVVLLPPVVKPAPPPPDIIDRYLDLVPAYNAVQPKFMATLAATLRPVSTLQTFLRDLPEQFDLDTAVGAQLDVDGIWIGRSRFISAPIADVYFSWDTDGLGWEEGTWQGTFDPDEGITSLDDETYRQLLYAKVAANHWDSSITGIQDIFSKLFANEGVSVRILDNQDMTMTVDALGTISNLVFRALLLGGYIPIKPVGVSINYVLDAVAGGQPGEAVLSGIGHVLSPITTAKMQARATIGGVGVLMETPPKLGSVVFSGVGGFTARAREIATAFATIAGVGTLTTAVPYTNYVRNPRAEGTLGADPTDWAYISNGMTLAKSMPSVGLDTGIPYADWRLVGTPTASGVVQMFVDVAVTGGSTGVANATTWSYGAWLKVSGGSTSGVSAIRLKLVENHLGAYLTEHDLDVTPTGALQFFHNDGITLSSGGVDSLAPAIEVSVTAGSSVDMTLRIGAPKLERALVTLPFVILPPVGAIPPSGSGTTILQ